MKFQAKFQHVWDMHNLKWGEGLLDLLLRGHHKEAVCRQRRATCEASSVELHSHRPTPTHFCASTSATLRVQRSAAPHHPLAANNSLQIKRKGGGPGKEPKQQSRFENSHCTMRSPVGLPQASRNLSPWSAAACACTCTGSGAAMRERALVSYNTLHKFSVLGANKLVECFHGWLGPACRAIQRVRAW